MINLKVLISSRTIIFLQSPSWECLNKAIFCPTFKVLFVWMKLCNLTNSRVLISNVNIFKVAFQKHSSKANWSRIWGFSFLNKALHFAKFEGADFKFYSSFFQIITQKYTDKTIWSRQWFFFGMKICSVRNSKICSIHFVEI